MLCCEKPVTRTKYVQTIVKQFSQYCLDVYKSIITVHLGIVKTPFRIFYMLLLISYYFVWLFIVCGKLKFDQMQHFLLYPRQYEQQKKTKHLFHYWPWVLWSISVCQPWFPSFSEVLDLRQYSGVKVRRKWLPHFI